MTSLAFYHKKKARRAPIPRKPKRTHCKRGHEFTPENTYEFVRNGKAGRHCKECNRMNQKIRYDRIEKKWKESRCPTANSEV